VTETKLLSILGRHRAPTLCVTAFLLTVSARPLRAEIVDRVMAVVGSEVVTLSDVRAADVFGLAVGATPATTDMLAYLINREVMLREVDRYAAPDPEPAVLERRVAQVRARFSTQELYEQALARTAMTEGRLRAVIAENLRVETYLEQRFGTAAQPTPDEVQRYYREHHAEFTREGRLAPFDEVQQAVQQKLAGERRRELIADWLDRLRRRSQVEILHPAPVSGK
jgi:parvulin-like peptidyl-prolyl isomerase